MRNFEGFQGVRSGVGTKSFRDNFSVINWHKEGKEGDVHMAKKKQPLKKKQAKKGTKNVKAK
jgi:hypothetical protein